LDDLFFPFVDDFGLGLEENLFLGFGFGLDLHVADLCLERQVVGLQLLQLLDRLDGLHGLDGLHRLDLLDGLQVDLLDRLDLLQGLKGLVDLGLVGHNLGLLSARFKTDLKI
jgi:hypothetical protein